MDAAVIAGNIAVVATGNNIVVIFSAVAVIITSADIGLVGANAGLYLWLWLRLVYGPFGLVSIVEAGALELKSIIPIISSSSYMFFRFDQLIQFKLYFIHWLHVQTVNI